MTFAVPIELAWTIPLASVRIMALMLAAPIFGHAAVPLRIRVALGVVLAVAIAPVMAASAKVPDPSPVALVGLVGLEALIGASLGFGLRVIFEVFSPVGELISLQGGLGAASVLDPSSGASSVVLGVLLQLCSLIVFLAIDGHHGLVRGIAESFERLPIGGAAPSADVFAVISALGSVFYEMTARLAVPFTVVMLVVNVGVGILGRSIPQLNLMALQLPAQIAITLLIMGLVANPLAEAMARTLTDVTGRVLTSVLGGS